MPAMLQCRERRISEAGAAYLQLPQMQLYRDRSRDSGHVRRFSEAIPVDGTASNIGNAAKYVKAVNSVQNELDFIDGTGCMRSILDQRRRTWPKARFFLKTSAQMAERSIVYQNSYTLRRSFLNSSDLRWNRCPCRRELPAPVWYRSD